MAVLRREVDRMQVMLEEFLNFSRPLVPLALEEADVAGPGARRGRAARGQRPRARGAALGPDEDAPPVRVRCDPRKVKQVLINLVQNALEASPPGGEVSVAVTAGAPPSTAVEHADGARGGWRRRSEVREGARVRVLDRGPGVDPALGEAVFQRGRHHQAAPAAASASPSPAPWPGSTAAS